MRIDVNPARQRRLKLLPQPPLVKQAFCGDRGVHQNTAVIHRLAHPRWVGWTVLRGPVSRNPVALGIPGLWSQYEGEGEVTQSCPTLCNPRDCSLPGSSVHGILQGSNLELPVRSRVILGNLCNL